jgi:hypothetical protein
LIGRHAARILEEKRDLERTPLRPRQGGEDVVESSAEQVG